MKRIFLFSILCFALLAVQNKPKFDYSRFDTILKENVDTDGMVNYEGIKGESSFYEYLKSIGNADTSSFSPNEKLAFYINAYNACVIKNVLDHMPIDSPMDVDGFFTNVKFDVAGNNVTLDELEHKYIFPLESVTVHFGLVCAARSCPKLLNTVYTEKDVRMQLAKNGYEFLNNNFKNRLDRKNNILYLSSIFKWFQPLFEKKFGTLNKTAIYYLGKSDKKYLKNNKVTLRFIDYNWELNKQ